MSDVIIPYEFLCKGGTAAAVAAWNGIPKARQIILETDTGRYKVGDGATHYNDLPYFAGPIGDLSDVDAPSPSDGQVLTWDAASSRYKPMTPTSGGMSLVASASVAGSAATSLSLSGLDLDAHGRYIAYMVMKNATASNAVLSLYYNSDTTDANYWRQAFNANNAILSASRANDAAIVTLVSSVNLSGKLEIAKDIDGNPRANTSFGRDAPSSVRIDMTAHVWTGSANVTGLRITSSIANALAVGSYIKVYKLP